MKRVKIAEQLAKENKYDYVTFYSNWNGFDVYMAERKPEVEGEILSTGYPVFIIVDDSAAHFASSDETFDIMGIHAAPKGYTEKL